MTQRADAPTATESSFAGWGSRVAAHIVDTFVPTVLFAVLMAAYGTKHTTSSSVTFELTGWPLAVFFVPSLAWFGYNWLYLQGTTGQTFGKKFVGIAVYQAGTLQPLGAGPTFARSLVHVVDVIPCFVGFLWPLWDKEHRTFADMIMSSRVYQV